MGHGFSPKIDPRQVSESGGTLRSPAPPCSASALRRPHQLPASLRSRSRGNAPHAESTRETTHEDRGASPLCRQATLGRRADKRRSTKKTTAELVPAAQRERRSRALLESGRCGYDQRPAYAPQASSRSTSIASRRATARNACIPALPGGAQWGTSRPPNPLFKVNPSTVAQSDGPVIEHQGTLSLFGLDPRLPIRLSRRHQNEGHVSSGPKRRTL